MPHPLDVKGAASEKRWQQSRHDLFQPVPISIAFVAISTGGKTSQMLTVANAILPTAHDPAKATVVVGLTLAPDTRRRLVGAALRPAGCGRLR